MPHPYFDQLAGLDNPGRTELQLFIEGVIHLLRDLLDGSVIEGGEPEMPALFKAMRKLAVPTFFEDVLPWFEQVRADIPDISTRALAAHGLQGRPLAFKFDVLDIIERALDRLGDFTHWIKTILAAIDVILESVLSALIVSGIPTGTLGKEFKQMVEAAVI
jgi:hypothetical protein